MYGRDVSPRKIPWWLALLFGLVGLVRLTFTVATYIAGRQVARIAMTRIGSVQFPSGRIAAPLGHAIELSARLDGSPVEDLQWSVFAIRNTGNQVVTHLPPELLYVQFPESVKILAADLVGPPGDDLSFAVRPDAQQRRVYLDFGRLRPGDQFEPPRLFRRVYHLSPATVTGPFSLW